MFLTNGSTEVTGFNRSVEMYLSEHWERITTGHDRRNGNDDLESAMAVTIV